MREIAVDLLRQEKGVGEAVHYKDWYELLLVAGLRARRRQGSTRDIPDPDRARPGRRICAPALRALPRERRLVRALSVRVVGYPWV